MNKKYTKTCSNKDRLVEITVIQKLNRTENLNKPQYFTLLTII